MKYLSWWKKISWREWVAVSMVVLLFGLMSWLAWRYGDDLKEMAFLESGIGKLFYVITMALGSFTPLSSTPLIPLAVVLWGRWLTGVLTVIGWWLGALIAFGLARKFGKVWLRKIISWDRLVQVESLIPRQNLFLNIVLLRLALPVDVLSFALGLFSPVSFLVYATASLVAIILFAVLLTYLVIIPWYWQITLGAIAMLIIFMLNWRSAVRVNRNSQTMTVLKKIIILFGDNRINFVVGGQTGLIVQGVDIEDDQEIDIITSKDGLLKIDRLLEKFRQQKTRYFKNDNFQAEMGWYELEGIRIEVMADPKAKMKSGIWQGVPPENVHETYWNGLKIKVFTLVSELEYYRNRPVKLARNKIISTKIKERMYN